MFLRLLRGKRRLLRILARIMCLQHHQLPVCLWIIFKRFLPERVFPEDIFCQNPVHHAVPVCEYFRVSGVGNQYQVQCRKNVDVLSQHTVENKAFRQHVHPDLVAVAGIYFAAGGDLKADCLRHPLFGDQLPAHPLSFMQIQQTELCSVLRAQIHAPAALCNAPRCRFPESLPDPHGFKKPLLQEREKGFSGHFRHNRGQQVGIHAVVMESGARRPFQ